ncbi:MAG: AAA family ATPase [Nitrospira sp.]|nr:AAA family ATPase [Nitrospira sp.]
MELTIQRTSGDPLTVSVEVGQQLYVVGANGTGKSALFQHWVSSAGGSAIKRIAAHRQTWFESGNLDFTARSRRDFEMHVRSWDREVNARWMEHSPAQRQSAVLFDLVAKENSRAREIARLVDNRQTDKAKEFAGKSESPFEQLNDLLGLGNLDISLSNSNDEEIVARHRDGDTTFSIAQMSDGERSAAIMAAHVLVAESETVFLIDEPERHLHRSIIEPFLVALFAQRGDCTFIISTHEIALPIANTAAHVVILRSCVWNGSQPRAWDAEVLESGATLPEDLKRDILGARRRILFVEGTPNSRDLPLYEALFPELSVIPKGSCNEVIRAVNGLRNSQEYHHVEAFGLIDGDDRQPDETKTLAESGIFALDVCSVESLYYCSDAIEAVAYRQAESLGCESNAMIETATRLALEALGEDALPERMAAKRCERRVRRLMEALIPGWQTIMESGQHLQIPSTVESPYADELARFRNLVSAEDLDGLIARYALRESNVFDKIVKTLECGSMTNYESMVVARVRKDENLARKLKHRIKPLAELIDAGPNHDS